MEENKMSCCKTCCLYTILALNIFLTIIILLYLFLSTYDVGLLDWYQYLYLVLATIVWLLLFIYYVGKLVLIIIGRLPTEYLKLVWIALNAPALLFFLIGLIFDIVMYTKNEIKLFFYLLIYCIHLVLFLAFTICDFFQINYQIQISENKKSSSNDHDITKKVEVKSEEDLRINQIKIIKSKMKSN